MPRYKSTSRPRARMGLGLTADTAVRSGGDTPGGPPPTVRQNGQTTPTPATSPARAARSVSTHRPAQRGHCRATHSGRPRATTMNVHRESPDRHREVLNRAVTASSLSVSQPSDLNAKLQPALTQSGRDRVLNGGDAYTSSPRGARRSTPGAAPGELIPPRVTPGAPGALLESIFPGRDLRLP